MLALLRRGVRLRGGRAAVYLEPRDAWVGAYFGDTHVYICPLPFLVIRLGAPDQRHG